jgi:hypothetical protein
MSGDNMQQLNAIAGEFNKHATVPVCIAAAIYGNCYRIDDQKHSRAFSHDKVETTKLAEKIYSRLFERYGGQKPAYSAPANAKVDLMKKVDTRGSFPKKSYDNDRNPGRNYNIVAKDKSKN